jgi:pantothenate synthetase
VSHLELIALMVRMDEALPPASEAANSQSAESQFAKELHGSLVRGLADAFFLPTAIVACPTIRESDGLALSSRNRRLSPSDRQKASQFYRALSTSPTSDVAVRTLRAAGFAVDYIEDRGGRRLGAVRLGDVRLIDNVIPGGQP